jgi:hypothetical protein
LNYYISEHDENAVPLIQSKKVLGYANKKDLINSDNIEKYKMCVHERLGFACLPYGNSKVIGLKEIHGLKPNEIPAVSEIAIAYADSIEELNPLYKYYSTRFVRFLVFAANMSSHYTHPQMWRFVPMQDFSNTSDINWNNSVDEIDKQLFDKYELTKDEIDCIYETIKPFEKE